MSFHGFYKPSKDVVGYEVYADVIMFRKHGGVYAYLRPKYAIHEGLAFPLDMRLHYMGKVTQEAMWKPALLNPTLQKLGYTVQQWFFPELRKRKRGRKPKPKQRFESEREWIANELEQGEVENITSRYETAAEFLESYPDDEEMARDIYGDEDVDEYYREQHED